MVRHVKYFLGLRYQVSGWEHLQTDGPYVIISNHQSSLDVLGELIHTNNQHSMCSVSPLLPFSTWHCVSKSCLKSSANMTRPAWIHLFLHAHPDVTWSYLCNQSFYTDSLLISAGMMEILPDRCTMIAKKELIWAGTVGMICWLGGIVFINRQKTSDAKNVMSDAAKTMLADKVCLYWDKMNCLNSIHVNWWYMLLLNRSFFVNVIKKIIFNSQISGEELHYPWIH